MYKPFDKDKQIENKEYNINKINLFMWTSLEAKSDNE